MFTQLYVRRASISDIEMSFTSIRASMKGVYFQLNSAATQFHSSKPFDSAVLLHPLLLHAQRVVSANTAGKFSIVSTKNITSKKRVIKLRICPLVD